MSDIVFWRPPPNLNRRSNRRPKSPEPTRGRARTGARSRAPSSRSPCPMPQSLHARTGACSRGLSLTLRCSGTQVPTRSLQAVRKPSAAGGSDDARGAEGASTWPSTWGRSKFRNRRRRSGGRSRRVARRGSARRRSGAAATTAGASRDALTAALACEWPQSGPISALLAVGYTFGLQL